MNTAHDGHATARQLGLIKELISKYDVPDAFVEELRNEYMKGNLTREKASMSLSLMSTFPKRPAANIKVSGPTLVALGQHAVRVQPTRDGSYRTFVLSKSGVFKERHIDPEVLRKARRLNADEAQAFERATSFCATCGTTKKNGAHTKCARSAKEKA